MGVGFTQESTSVPAAATAVPERVVLAARPQASLRLYALPPAGAGPDCYLRWVPLLPPWIELCSVALPGRGTRAGEPSLTDPAYLSARLAAVLDDWTDPRPFAVFGHSAGALLAYEATRHLRRTHGRPPALLAVSSLSAPHLDAYSADLPPRLTAGLAGLRELVGPIPEQLLADARLMAAACTPLLADLLLLLHYRHHPEPPLRVPLALYGGELDPVTGLRQLRAWNDLVTTPASAQLFPGGHGYLQTSAKALVDHLTGVLGTVIEPPVATA
ncbi:thioesterase [Streptomyces sioyaensis]|uniref:Thioesterase n=1 Tax=Streptomyces sioyaensis TaxID=67364 RepID=A0A4V1NQQ6_9ACTN|nr:alpha/beta fold hydrolase [Streptomyces sioyaensis]MBM4791673.1 thioesterase [Streptomyces sioyaensis]RXS69149.1 thioesterase [Streptomyces sioyaensis]